MNAVTRLEQPRVHICSMLFRPNAVSPIYTVLCDGEIYSNVNKYLLAALKGGMTPSELDMAPAEEEDPWNA